MIKKLKNWIGGVWALKVIYPYVMRNEVQTTLWMRAMIVSQLWQSGLKFHQINKWLVYMKFKPVVEYYFPNGEQQPPVVTTKPLTEEQRKGISVRIYKVTY